MTQKVILWNLITHSPEETIRLGQEIGSRLRKGDVLILSGDLGAGKTTLTKGIAIGLGAPGDVFSPTFTIVHEYREMMPLYHIDLYRISGENEVVDLGLEEYFASDGVCVVEWGERLGSFAPRERLDIVMSFEGDEERGIEFIPRGDRFRNLIEELKSAYTSD